jgi:hypothetical protein
MNSTDAQFGGSGERACYLFEDHIAAHAGNPLPGCPWCALCLSPARVRPS